MTQHQDPPSDAGPGGAHIIRRAPTEAIPVASPSGSAPGSSGASAASAASSTSATSATSARSATSATSATSARRAPARREHPSRSGPRGSAEEPSATAPIATAAVAIVSGWATGVVATDLVTGWWRSDRLFCIAVAFLTLVFAVATVSGVILLLRRRLLGSYLIAVGAAVALLTFISLFIAGARVPWVVHGIPVLQAASAVLALLPATKRWLRS